MKHIRKNSIKIQKEYLHKGIVIVISIFFFEIKKHNKCVVKLHKEQSKKNAMNWLLIVS